MEDNIYTEWYPSDTLPVRNGIYQVKLDGVDIVWYAKFLNGEWYDPRFSFQKANLTELKLHGNPLQWRGLTKDAHDYMAMSFVQKFLFKVFG